MHPTTEEIESHLFAVNQWEDEFQSLLARIESVFARSESRHHAHQYIQGLLSHLPRKNSWHLAEFSGDSTPYGKQNLLGRSTWCHNKLLKSLHPFIEESLGDNELTLSIDDTGFLKKGVKSAGVHRQYTGTAGGVDNCQLGVFLTYATSKGHAMWDRKLYVPKVWMEDEARRKEAKIPDELEFAQKYKQACSMLEDAFEHGLKPQWVLGDAGYGNNSQIFNLLQEHRCPYVLGIKSDRRLFYEGQRMKVSEIVAQCSPDSWKVIETGLGSKGKRLAKWFFLTFNTPIEGFKKALMVRVLPGEKKNTSYFFGFAKEGTSDEDFAKAEGRRWRIEESFEQTKQEVGLADYEVRSWHGWYRHITLSMVAYAFLAAMRAQDIPELNPLKKTKANQNKLWKKFRQERGLKSEEVS